MANILKYSWDEEKQLSIQRLSRTLKVPSKKLVHFVNIARVSEGREIALGLACSSRAGNFALTKHSHKYATRGRPYNNF